ncbi:MAG: low molecular weight phosphatase family protein [Planctomycetota bacterium]|jgi:protein-tyrosine phosphatase/arsenate reductase
MKKSVVAAIILLIVQPVVGGSKQGHAGLYPDIQKHLRAAVGEFDRIGQQRRDKLREISAYVRFQKQLGKPVNLTFICTSNTRRSQMAQIWAQAAAAFYSIPNVTTYSGGIGSAAFNPRAVASVRRAGFKVEKTTEADNPIYHVRYSDQRPAVTNFSKVYDSAPNPTKDFCAVMTCSDADKACPVVRGASARTALPFVDPKAFDGTDQEAAKYDERSRQICREMLYVFSQAKK